MIHPEALTRLRLLAGAVPAAPAAGGNGRELPPLQPGQPIDGRIERQTRAGYIVSVRGRSYDFRLPRDARPGDFLRMVYVSDSPRPTFALLGIERMNGPTGSNLSDAGRLLATLREARVDAPEDPAARATIPLFESGAPEAPQAARLLRDALALSGLFYESHQAQWVLGTRSTAQLQLEPQGRIAPSQPAPDVIEPQAAPVAGEATRNAPAPPAGAIRHSGSDSSPQPEPVSRPPAHPDSFPIIRQQLSALESGDVAWRGLVWPGQHMEWRVGDGAAGAREGSEAQRVWRTELKLTLLNIGNLLARIELDANGAKLRMIADSEQHARRLREEAPALADRLDMSGIPVRALEVSHEPEPG